MRHGIVAAGLWFALLFNTTAAGSPLSSLDFDAWATVDVTADGHAHVVEMGKVSKLSDVASLAPIAEQIRNGCTTGSNPGSSCPRPVTVSRSEAAPISTYR